MASRPRSRARTESRRPRRGTAAFIIDRETDLRALHRIGRSFDSVLRDYRKGDGAEPSYVPPAATDSAQIAQAVDRALARLPAYMRVAGFAPLNRAEQEDARRAVTAFLEQWIRTPPLDLGLIRGNMEFGGLRCVPGGGPLILADRHGLALSNGLLFNTGSALRSDPEVSKGAFAADLILELIGLLLGIIGIELPKGKSIQNAVVGWVSGLLEKKEYRDAFAKLLKALRSGKWAYILEWFELIEGGGNFTELLYIIFAHYTRWDYALTTLKILAWFASIAVGPGWARIALKIAEVILDLVGLYGKIDELEKVWKEA